MTRKYVAARSNAAAALAGVCLFTQVPSPLGPIMLFVAGWAFSNVLWLVSE